MVSHFRMPLGHWTRETVPNFWDRLAPLFRVLGVSRSAVSLRVLVTPVGTLFQSPGDEVSNISPTRFPTELLKRQDRDFTQLKTAVESDQ